jgi:hypothetical protein
LKRLGLKDSMPISKIDP